METKQNKTNQNKPFKIYYIPYTEKEKLVLEKIVGYRNLLDRAKEDPEFLETHFELIQRILKEIHLEVELLKKENMISYDFSILEGLAKYISTYYNTILIDTTLKEIKKRKYLKQDRYYYEDFIYIGKSELLELLYSNIYDDELLKYNPALSIILNILFLYDYDDGENCNYQYLFNLCHNYYEKLPNVKDNDVFRLESRYDKTDFYKNSIINLHEIDFLLFEIQKNLNYFYRFKNVKSRYLLLKLVQRRFIKYLKKYQEVNEYLNYAHDNNIYNLK